jgi:hypothetical protein
MVDWTDNPRKYGVSNAGTPLQVTGAAVRLGTLSWIAESKQQLEQLAGVRDSFEGSVLCSKSVRHQHDTFF